MDISIISGIVTIAAFISAIAFGAYQYIQAKNSDKKLEEAKTNIKELEEGLLLSNYKLKKAVEFYKDGHYKNALEVFKKYSAESEDTSEFVEVIRKIFWEETRKIYSQYMGNGWEPLILISTIITKKDDVEASYPSILIELMDIYKDKTNTSLAFWRVPVLLNQREYKEALKYIPKFRAKSSSTEADQSFNEFLTHYCERQLESA